VQGDDSLVELKHSICLVVETGQFHRSSWKVYGRGLLIFMLFVGLQGLISTTHFHFGKFNRQF